MEEVQIIKDVKILKGVVRISSPGGVLYIGKDSIMDILGKLEGKELRVSIQTKSTRKITKSD